MNIEHQISATFAWHGRLMVLSWTILLPIGILIARYFKVTPMQDWPNKLDNKLWWHSHLALQISGVLCMSIGVGLVWVSTGRTAFGQSLHASLGWLVVLSGWMQLVGGYLRGSKGGPLQADTGFDASSVRHGDHYDMTRRRVIFEWLHKLCGYGALLLSILVTGLGLKLAAAPLWMYMTIGLWWVAVLVVAYKLQRAGRCIDTYQAIWGPDTRHPGNSCHVIGWGISRYTVDSYRKRFGPPRAEAPAPPHPHP